MKELYGLSLVSRLRLNDWKQANESLDTEVTNDLNDAYTRMQSIGQTYAVVGNHDCSPVNSFPPAAVDTTITSQVRQVQQITGAFLNEGQH